MIHVEQLLPPPPLWPPGDRLAALHERERANPGDPDIQLDLAHWCSIVRDSHLVGVVMAARHAEFDMVEQHMRVWAELDRQVLHRTQIAAHLIEEQRRCAELGSRPSDDVDRATRPKGRAS